MVDRCVAVSAHDVAAVANHHPHRERAHLAVDLAAFTARLTAGKPGINRNNPSPPPVGLVGAEGEEPGHPGIRHGESEMPVPGHALHVRRLDLQNTGLGCQPVTQLVQQIFPPLADFAMDRAHAARLSASARRSLSCGAKAPLTTGFIALSSSTILR
jgi:hypothetical protein